MLKTEDIVVLSSDGWKLISCPGTILHILEIKNSEIQLRPGSVNGSDGMKLVPGDTISIDEGIYVKSVKPYVATVPAVITVSRDGIV